MGLANLLDGYGPVTLQCQFTTVGRAKAGRGNAVLSGGRENGLTTLAHYTRIKSVQVELGGYASVF